MINGRKQTIRQEIIDALENNALTVREISQSIGIMEKDEANKVSMSKVTLRPKISFSGDRQPTFAQLEKMHHQSHEQCFIANSVKTEVVTEIILND